MDQPIKISILDLLIILLERRWLLIFSIVGFSICGLILSSIIPKEYTAKAIIMKSSQKMGGSLGALVGKDLPISGLLKSMDLIGGDNEQFLSILESRRMSEKVIDHFNLISYFGFDKHKKYFIEDVIKHLRRNVSFFENDYSNIEIAVTDTSPKLSAEMANYIISQLDSISYDLARERARNSRLFFADRLNAIKANLDIASKNFSNYQIQNNYIDLNQQIRSSIEALAGIEAQKIAYEMEGEQIRSQFDRNNQRLNELEKNITILNGRLEHYMNSGSGNLIVALRQAPSKAVEYGYLLRDVKVQESLYEYVMQLFEQAQFAESNNTPTVQVLELAKMPQKKTRPKRSVICIMFFGVGLILTSIYILLWKWFDVQHRRESDVYKKIIKIRGYLVPFVK